MTPHKLSSPRVRRFLTPLLALSMALPAFAQVANNPVSQPEAPAKPAVKVEEAPKTEKTEKTQKTDDKGVLVLSPFEVNAMKDYGYAASSALSGTRLNSSLDDIAAAVSVVTKQQLQDTAAIDLNDIFMYEANTEGIYQYTELTTDARAGVVDQVSNNPETANRIRGIGNANMAINGFAMNSAIPVDTYNIKQVEIARGPNSNLFGIGQVAGTVNLINEAASTTRESTNVETSVNSYGGWRASFGANRPIVKDKFGLYLATVHDEKGFMRKPSFDKTDRLYLAGVFQPTRLTKLTASVESYKNSYSRPNYTTPRENVSLWKSLGSHTWDPVTWTAKKNGVAVGTFVNTTARNNALTPLGLAYEGSAAARPNWFIIDDQVAVYSQGVGGASPGNQRLAESAYSVLPVLYQRPGTTDESFYDWRHDSLTAANYGEKRGKTYQVQFEQFILEPAKTKHHTLALQLGWQRQDVENMNRSFLGYSDGAPLAVEVDVNERLPDGSANPGFLRPYFNTSLPPLLFKSPYVSDHLRGTLAYQLDLTGEAGWLKWLGRHTFAAYGESRDTKSGTLRYRDQIVSQHAWLGTSGYLSNNGAAVNTRYYLGTDPSSLNAITGRPERTTGMFAIRRWDATAGRWTTEDVEIQNVFFAGSKLQHQIRSQGVVWQGFLWGDRIVPTIGLREDRSRSRWNAGFTASSPLGYFSDEELANLDNFDTAWNVANPDTGADEVRGKTSTKGVVFKPFKWMHLTYNRSDSFQPAGFAIDPVGNVLPNPTGTGEDYGVRFSLLKDRLSLRYSRYENFSKDSRSGTANIFAERLISFDFDARIKWTWDLESFATDWVNQLHPDSTGWTADRRRTEVLRMMGLTEEQVAGVKKYSVNATNDIFAEGQELELVYNPTNYWTMKLTGAEQVSINSNIAGSIEEYYLSRKEIWENIRIPTDLKPDGTQLAGAGQRWWDQRRSGNSVSNWYTNIVSAPYKLEVALQGKPRPQVRRYRLNFTTNLRLAGLTDQPYLKDMAVGGAVRWEDQASIGFGPGTPDADGVIRTLDPTQPFFDEGHTYVDLWWKYNFKFSRDRLRGSVQLNVRNAFEGGRLQGVGANPDGEIWAYRIVDPRQFILTTTFAF